MCPTRGSRPLKNAAARTRRKTPAGPTGGRMNPDLAPQIRKSLNRPASKTALLPILFPLARRRSVAAALLVGQPVNAFELAPRLGCSRKSIYREVAALRRGGMRIAFDSRSLTFHLRGGATSSLATQPSCGRHHEPSPKATGGAPKVIPAGHPKTEVDLASATQCLAVLEPLI